MKKGYLISKGYFVIKTFVFHNQQSKNEFLLDNLDYIHISRKDINKIFKSHKNKDLECKSCEQIHHVSKIQWSKIKDVYEEMPFDQIEDYIKSIVYQFDNSLRNQIEQMQKNNAFITHIKIKRLKKNILFKMLKLETKK